MKFVSLLSGGKDSCFNVIKCIEYGHELVCLANLAPPEAFDGEDMDSFMYQTAGHVAIPYLAECFGVPLIRHHIAGTAVTQQLDYLERVDNDEVEDLYQLLQKVKLEYPEIEGVSCGAILSTYQRLRVEQVCQRLGLTVLSFLWMRDRVALLQEMIQSGVDAVLVKVAGAGLEPNKHLGKTLSMLRPTLMRLHEQYGLDVCGEGGEYESLVLDCPAFKRKLVLQKTEVIVDDENYTVGYLKISSCSTAEKDATSVGVTAKASNLWLQRQLSALVQQALSTASPHSETTTVNSPDIAGLSVHDVEERDASSTFQSLHMFDEVPKLVMGSDGFGQTSLLFPSRETVFPSDRQAAAAGAETYAVDTTAVQAQLRSIFSALQSLLTTRTEVSLQDCVFVHLYIRDSAIFKAVNDEYCKWFGHYPPSRSCVCVPLPPGIYVCMDAYFLKDSHFKMLKEGGRSSERSVLHVKSMSEWAPLCIGPYAQANTVHGSLVFVAGQIPLDPATMGLFNPQVLTDKDASLLTNLQACCGVQGDAAAGFLLQLALCLRHVHRVLQATNSSLDRALLCTVYVNAAHLPADVMEALSDEKIQFLVRHLVAGMAAADTERTTPRAVEGEGDEDSGEYDEEDESDPCGDDVQDVSEASKLPVLVICTSGLPRDALVEVEIVGFTNNSIPRELFLAATSSTEDQKDRKPSSKPTHNLVDTVDAWPVWPHQRVVSTTPAPGSCSAEPIGDATGRWRSTSSVTSLPRSLCAGFVQVQTFDGLPASSSTVSLQEQLRGAAAALVSEVACMLDQTCVQHIFLRSLRIYYAASTFAAQSLCDTIAVQVVKVLGLQDFPMVLVPMQSLGISTTGVILAAQVLAVDLAQLDTEAWVHVKE